MRRIYATFSGPLYYWTTREIVERAPRMGADEVWVYDNVWLTDRRQEFVRQNRWLFEHPCVAAKPFHDELRPRGVCWFAWKPLVILDALDRLAPGDMVLYTDADTFPLGNFSVLYDQAARDGGIMLFSAVGQLHERWCKRDCFAVMGQMEPRWWEGGVQHAVARFMVFQKAAHPTNHRPSQLLWEWYTYSINPLATTFDMPSRLGLAENPNFVEHRCEQAILTNLAHKYGFKLYREACEFGNSVGNDKGLYGQLFHQEIGRALGPVACRGSVFRNIDD